MKSRLIALIAILFILASGLAYADAKPEYRVLQVHTWIPGMLSPQQVDETVKWAKDANFNIVVLQARRVGDACYNSAYEPRMDGIEGPKDFDPIGYGIKKCHENGLQAYVWFNVYRVWSSSTRLPKDPKHVINRHPEWRNKNFEGKTGSDDGVFLDPGIPEVRAYTVKVMGGLVSKYSMDGIMLDFVRYPDRDWGYSDIAVARFNKQYGRKGKPDPRDLTWGRWRREQVTQMVREINAEIKRRKPKCVLSAATIPWGICPQQWSKTDAFAAVFQDWRLWMEEGILDVNMPMNYKNPGKERDQGWYVDWLEGMKKWQYGRHAISIVMVLYNNVDGAVNQVKLARDHGLIGGGGFAFSQGKSAADIAKGLKTKVYTEPAPVPTCPWLEKAAEGTCVITKSK